MDKLPYRPVRIVGYLDPDLKRRLQMRLAELSEQRLKRFTYNDWLRGQVKRELGELGREPCYNCGTSKAQADKWIENGALACCEAMRHEPE